MNNAYIRAQQLRVKEAKFPFVKIGIQYWTTKNLSLSVTPQGNTIPEMQANGNVENITNIADREFSSDTGFWSKGGDAIIIGGEVYKSGGSSTQFISKSFNPKQGVYYKLSFSYRNITGANVSIRFAGGSGGTNLSYVNGTGMQTLYVMPKAGNDIAQVICNTSTTTGYIDNVSIQEIGWLGSQELYDGIYAQTSGTVEQKTYAAVKAAAMWCNYNNDPILGGIYGKLYNWFAVKLFQMDIDYYNAANSTKPYIWRMPTQEEFQSLSTYLGGDSVSGGHLKEAGLAHWNSPNAGADNSSGFSAVGGGKRLDDGTLQALKFDGICWTITDNELLANRLYIASGTTLVDYIQTSKKRGYSIRLIKA